MKFKVKGLVFVGFAAAILSANAALADPDNTVTSKSYVDTHFQEKVGGGTNANKLVQATDTAGVVEYVEIGNAIADITEGSEKVVTGNAVAAALEQNGGQVNNSQMNITQNGVDAGHFNANQASSSTVAIVAPSWDATSSQQGFIADKPSIVNAGTSIGSADGTATKELPTTYAVKDYVGSEISGALQNGVAGDGYVTATYNSTNNDTTVALDSTKITSSSTFSDDSTNLTREQDVKGYVDGKVSDALNNGVEGNGYVTDSYDSSTNKTTVALDSTKITSTTTLTDGSTKLAREGDVKGYVDTQDALKVSIAQGAGAANKTLITDANGNVTVSAITTAVIPAIDPAVCNATTPCALVTNETTGAAEWQPIAQATANVGE